MATVTANISLSSSDLIPSQVLSMSASKTLYKAGSSAECVDQADMGRVEIVTGTNFDLFSDTAAAANKRNYVYISNLTTTETNYVVVSSHDHVIGRLYAGDFMWLPCSFTDGGTAGHDDIEVESFNGTATLEYALFHEGKTLATAADS
jgi:hypothetical protein|tara:strand:- start:676 stop:1119 length:444 start_codon:yes stop_codon:yes gene_type:complete